MNAPFLFYLEAEYISMDSYIIGIDIGTGSTKAVAINTKGEILFSTQASYPSIHPREGWHEQAPELIWQGFIKCISRTLASLRTQPAGISLSSAMHSLVPVDENGSPLMNMITWADKRSASIAEHIRLSASGEMLYEQTGTPIHAMSPLCKIIWLRDHDETLFNKTHKFISIKEFIWYKLFQVYEIDHSLASATGLFDIEKLTWNDNAITLASINADQLSKPVSTNHFRKDIREDVASLIGLSSDIPVIIGASDGCLANLGSFATEPGVAALTIGTSGAIRVGNQKPTFNFQSMTFNYVLDKNTFISGGPVNNGGVALKWYMECFLKKTLNTAEDYNLILGEIEAIEPGANGLIFLPYLLGERAPIWNSETCSVFFGATNQHKQSHFTRAVIEGITFALYDVASELEKAGLSINCINVSGGFVHSELWLQILSDIFNKKVCLINAEDASALGAGYLALKALNIIDSYDVLSKKEHKEFVPSTENHQRYQKSFARYKRLYHLLKDEMALDLS
jgi:gluconokinase